MYTHNLDPIFIDLEIFAIRWYSLAYIIGILTGWWLGNKIVNILIKKNYISFEAKEFDDLISYLVISIILGGRLGYIIFYNLNYYILNPFDIFKIWQGGMSFHGALIGIILGTYIFAIKKNIKILILLDIIACVSPIGLFFGRIANFINSELYGNPSNIYWSVIFPKIDNISRHPSQIYEAFLEGLLLFIILNFIIFKKEYQRGICSSLFLILYGIFRIFSEQFRAPDQQIGYLFNSISMGSLLSVLMIAGGILILTNIRKNEI